MSIENKKVFLKNLPSCPGVYQMLGKDQEVLYIGKAKNLKKRIFNYFKSNIDDKKTSVLTKQIINFKIIVTRNENEALLLENTLIKELKPKYNILFRDDKSYPYLLLSKHLFPRLILHRGIRKIHGDYYGPYPSATAAKETLHILQKVFGLRQCSDVFFRNRSRPCVQYQIKRCSAPCTRFIDEATYKFNVNCVKNFLSGNDRAIIQELRAKMKCNALNLNYEEAARYRDQIMNLQEIYEQQYVDAKKGNVDAIAIIEDQGYFSIQILFIRNGKVVGNKSYVSRPLYTTDAADILASFLSQYYLNLRHEKLLLNKILVNKKLAEQSWIEAAINKYASSKISITCNVRGNYRRWVEMAQTNAEHALAIHLATRNDYAKSLQDFKVIFKLPCTPQRIECFDISHTMGEFTVASCVVFGVDGPKKSHYRQFNIKNVTKSDDYAAISQVLRRRYKTKEFPDIVIIDGGKGQLTKAKSVIKNNDIVLLAIAKGPLRKPGFEKIYSTTLNKPISLSPDSSVLHLLQKIRDEAHRFAISAHRKKRIKIVKKSILETVKGIGLQNRKKILKYFGGIQEIRSATIQELGMLPGINQTLAERIYNSLHDDSN